MQPEESANGQGPASPRLQLVVFAGDEVRTLDLPVAGTVTIGRDENSTVFIDDPSVSRNHALLRVGPTLVIEDLGGANGTMVRDRAGPGTAAETLNVRQLIGRKADLAVGDTILFGTARVVVRHAPAVEVPDLAVMGDGVVVQDPAMRAAYQRAARAAPTPLSILILGETGVGKEVLARAIHAHSQRAKGPFMGINCGALSDSLLESELFGHEKGAFTGAVQARAGLFEAAGGGTVFLDEVGELSAATQVKLLRVLAERVVMRLGSTRPREIDVRIIAATNRDIETESRGGRFREDLFFRLNGISLTIPPLRERPGEIDDLARRFLVVACRLIERAEIPRISREAFELFHRYPWRGNVRELRTRWSTPPCCARARRFSPSTCPPPSRDRRNPGACRRGPPRSRPTSVLPRRARCQGHWTDTPTCRPRSSRLNGPGFWKRWNGPRANRVRQPGYSESRGGR